MKESSKSVLRRIHDSRFATRYLVGEGIDIGAGMDPISLYAEIFPLMGAVRAWDLQDGDAQYLASVADDSFDFVHSSHCLEHMRDPHIALQHWFRVLRPDGYLVFVVPDEDLYEQGKFPSTYNNDHKWTFTTWKAASWSKRSINLMQALTTLGASAQILKVELLDQSFRFELPRFDQTLTPIGECGIEVIVRKRMPTEIHALGRLAKEEEMSREEFHRLTGF